MDGNHHAGASTRSLLVTLELNEGVLTARLSGPSVGSREAAILNAEGNRQAEILNAEGFSLALERIYQAARGVDDKTMSLQYLDMMRSLASSDSTKWVIPMELTSFVSGFARNLATAAQPPAPPST